MIQKLRGCSLRSAVTFSAGSCYLLFGYDQGVLGGLVTVPSFLDAIDNPSSTYLGTIVGLFHIGCLVGCGIAGLLGGKLGRTKTIFWGCVIMVVGGTIQASCFGAPQMIVGRIVSGIGNGMNTATVPVYVSECSRAQSRGRSIAMQLNVVIFGTVLAYWLDYGTVTNLTGDVAWRFPIAFQNFFALITIITIPCLPETPRWLYSHGYKAESLEVYSRLMGCNRYDPEVLDMETELEAAIQFEEQSTNFSLKDVINDKTDAKNTRRLILCFLIQFFQQFTGINVIAFYAVTIVLESNVGLNKHTSSLVAGCIQIAFWLATFPPLYLLDRLGRRPMLLLGSTSLAICMILFTVGIALDTPPSSRMALAMLFLYEMSFGMSWNSIPWLYAAEITPLHLRHVGSAVGVFSEWLWTFVIAQMAPTAIANTGWRIYLLFCVMLFLSIPFSFFLLPETNGKTLEEIDFIFAKGEAKTSDTGCVEMNVTSSEDKQGVERHESICISPPVAV
ncbi:general substrate transporter [Neofusicoccum parvum]|uniref:General substrate transporter n=1 Tax=Neofusicoccum parvum TaxID=310453 RepID=A0ACB5SP51_9PEZI|nr:general substrate transporter [Neofusicoccum parvum]